ncbi:MAG TPA: glycosyltransferase [Candidatus Binatia bacterium]|nr:glycosyltransferase [Candidatus Binatia bacterium]
MKVALVHDVLNQLGGAEKVLENFLEIWPDATIHTVFYDEEKTKGVFAKYKKKISALDNFPFAHKHPKLFLPLIPFAFERFDFSEYDVVISDSSAFAKFVKTNKLNICYCHTPTRFLWTEPGYIDTQRYPWILKLLGKVILPFIRKWDYRAAQRPDYMLANSENVKSRIEKYYQRDSFVIPPPIDAEFYQPSTTKKDYFLTVSRLEPYKKIDLIIKAFIKLNLPLKVAGTGTLLNVFKAISGSNIEILGRVSDEELRNLYAQAKAFVFAAEEDAGITLLEAQAAGTPVIAYRAGGALEVVKEGVTGEFFNRQEITDIENAVKSFDSGKYNSQTVRANAMQFDKKNFQKQIREFVEQKFAHQKQMEESREVKL